MIKNDRWIRQMAERGMIEPFEPRQIRRVDGLPVLSYGLSSYGYDIRLSPTEFRVFRRIPGRIVDPKNFDPEHLELAPLHEGPEGKYFILPANSYGLGVSKERLQVPPNVTVLAIGKSTYARCGIIANITPAESGWRGYLTLEFSNASSADCKIYADEGVVQLIFLEGEPCEVTYADREGKYQDQPMRVILPRV
ncbi:MAG: dCTP deaminase [Bacteroidetes bacterium]|nr:dCTP deaminase [Rhodothermia bacterium]MCS7154183.1 dCTP deaminase [Bacteroidota bacterium]MCX7906781.1 dCTP deaminase [Bacteroidota bacterium]MDW8136939.1 dCTP deaminase [Bacteroidota bacterium]MDW8285190.1 dCTP deaminase [Bacteroidota bacterium]